MLSDGDAVFGVAGRSRNHAEYGGEHSQAKRKVFGIGRAAASGERLGETGRVQGRPAVRDRPGDESLGHGLGPPQDGKDDKPHWEGAAGGALGEQRQGEKRFGNMRLHPPFPQSTLHVRAPIGHAYRAVGLSAGV